MFSVYILVNVAGCKRAKSVGYEKLSTWQFEDESDMHDKICEEWASSDSNVNVIGSNGTSVH